MPVAWQVAGLALLAGALVAAAVCVLLDRRITPEKKERLRRHLLSRRGRLAEGTITDASHHAIFYSYSISGVAYTASQDIRCLNDYLPVHPERLVGPVSLKYSPQNPANSIIVGEQWSGLKPIARAKGANSC
jgi:hypothetical protein